jgi:cell division FtsZ-interacting protein ZapD
MSMQIPLQKTVIKVLKKTESSYAQATNEDLNAMAAFISNMLQWEHNEYLKHERFERLFDIVVKVVSQRGETCAFTYGKILFWLHGCDRPRFADVIRTYSLDELTPAISMILRCPIEVEWQGRVKLWDTFLLKLVDLTGLVVGNDCERKGVLT